MTTTINTTSSLKRILSKSTAAAVVALALVIVPAQAAGAIGIAGVSPAAGAAVHLSEGESFVLTVNASLNPGEILGHLEVDHSFEGESWFPEFNVYADEANPYGGAAEEAYANSVGVTVTYSASNLRWVIDFGPTITQMIRDDGRELIFYLVAHGEDGDGNPIASGHMGSPGNPMPEGVAFSYPPLAVDDEVADEVAPGVPNTAVGGSAASSTSNIALAGGIGAAVVLTAGVAIVRRSHS